MALARAAMIGQDLLHYRILQKLGGGGMGVVYKALDTRLHRLVVLKFLPKMLPTSREIRVDLKRLQREIESQRAASVDSQHEFSKEGPVKPRNSAVAPPSSGSILLDEARRHRGIVIGTMAILFMVLIIAGIGMRNIQGRPPLAWQYVS
jgi:serine/threonine protein kinase